MTANGALAALIFVGVWIPEFYVGLRNSWRDEWARIREAHRPAEPFVDYEVLHYGPALKNFLDKQDGAS